jgi:hypothetical protein
MRTLPPLSALVLAVACATTESRPAAPADTPPAAPPPSSEEDDVAAARAVFEANILAIQNKDRDAYLASYRADERLVRVGIGGPSLGFAELAEGTAPTGSDDWPERLVAEDMQLHWVAPGLVYGSYRYRVTIKGETTTGLSERVFLRGDDGAFRIAVTTAFEGEPPPPEEGEPAPAEPED